MQSRMLLFLTSLFLMLPASPAAAQEFGSKGPQIRSEKRALDHADFDRWSRVRGEALSSDGSWVLYTEAPGGEGDDRLVIQSLTRDRRFEVKRAQGARFTRDSRFVVYRVLPDPVVLKKAKKDKVPAARQPKASCEILELGSGNVVQVLRVKQLSLAEESGAVLAILLEEPLEVEAPAAEDTTPARESGTELGAEVPQPAAEPGEAAAKPALPSPAATGQPGAPTASSASGIGVAEKAKAKPGGKEKKEAKPVGSELILRRLATGAEQRFPHVTSIVMAEDGESVVLVKASVDDEPGGVQRILTANGESRWLHRGDGEARGVTIDKSGERVAFLFRPSPPKSEDSTESDETSKEEKKEEKAPWDLLTWNVGDEAARPATVGDRVGWPDGWEISEHRSPTFSKSGERLLFGIAPARYEAPRRDPESDQPEVRVDIWHWRDPLLQTQQLKTVEQERRRTFLAVAQLAARRVVVLADESVPNVSVGREGDGRWALGSTNVPYLRRLSWDSPRYYDHYLIDVDSGRRELVLSDLQASAQLSPEERYLTWWDGKERHWFALSVDKREIVNLTEHLPHAAWNQDQDTPSLPRAWGSPGWVEGDQMFLVYDRFDVWATSPEGFWPPLCLTEGVGRERGLRFRNLILDREQRALPLDSPMLLSAFDVETKEAGFYRDGLRSAEKPRPLLMAPARFSPPRVAEDADRLLFTKERFDQFPDLWVSDVDFGEMRRVSNANPQQAEYRWGSSELYNWTSLEGQELQGLLIKPEGFVSTRQYPMMVYFYEKNSDNLHRYVAPAPARANVNYSFYASRGYVVFVPDIPYRIGYPGLSALNAVLPGVTSLIDEGFVDRERIGVQGHSWGGYQVAYLVTRTNLFAAAEAGAPVSNMISAYGGIRWSTGMSRMFQYERTQSRIGGTLWEKTLPFIENSPIFWLESVETPLLILHNDQDGAVPWYQGIELFVGLRRLGKPAWLFNYNGEQHGLTQDHNRRDWSVRLQQFFDHYLQEAPPPVWLDRGVPAISKGLDLGLDLVGGEVLDPTARASAAKAEHDRQLAARLGADVRARKIRYTSSDGLEIPAYRFSPAGLREGQRRPGLVWLHGESTFDLELYLSSLKDAAAKGYVVLVPDVRGCTGYGAEHAARRDPGAGDVVDGRGAVAVLAVDPAVDATRIATIGWGSGGSIALHLALGADSPVRCAVAVSPQADLVWVCLVFVGVQPLVFKRLE